MPEIAPPRTEHKLSVGRYARDQLKRFSVALVKWRIEVGKLSRRALAAKVGCSSQQIANIEGRQCFPSFPVYVALCREMGTDPLPNFPTEAQQ